MLDSKSKKTLKLLNSFVTKTKHYSYSDLNTLNQALNIDKDDLTQCLDYLVSLDLVETKNEYSQTLYRSTIKGLTYFKDNHHQIIVEIVLVIISATISSVLTLLLSK